MPTKTKPETLAAALAVAQSEMTNATKNAQNAHLRNRYADLASVRDVVVPALNKHGIAVLQHIDGADGFCTVRTVLHYGAESMEVGNCTLPAAGQRNPAQAIGSIATYLRRYHLAAVGGIAQEDDDGNGAQSSKQRPQTRPQPRPQQNAANDAPKPPSAKPGPIACPICKGKTWDNRAYRLWRKDNPSAKDKAALACNDWKDCKWTAWATADAEKAIANANKPNSNDGGGMFDDGLNAPKGKQ